ncbi:MAG: glycosyltransferase family 2 protein [Thermacetogeniaceae bacterium]|jgi:GT2 family glycosyltransferase
MRNLYLAQQEANQWYEQVYLNPDTAQQGDSDTTSTAPCPLDMAPPCPQTDLLSIVMPVWTGGEITKQALQAILDHTHRPLEIIIIDNGSDTEARAAIDDFLRLHPAIARVIHNETNRGYPAACNQGLQVSQGRYLVVMNNDVLVTPYWASRMMAAFSLDAGVGAVGPRTNYVFTTQLVQDCDYNVDTLGVWAEHWHAIHAGTLRTTTKLIGFLMMIRREMLDRIGGFDPVFGLGNYDDDDYCLRARLAGYQLLIADDVFVHHYGSLSFNKNPAAFSKLLEKNREVFAAKWGLDLQSPPEQVISLDRARNNLYIPLA